MRSNTVYTRWRLEVSIKSEVGGAQYDLQLLFWGGYWFTGVILCMLANFFKEFRPGLKSDALENRQPNDCLL